MWYPITVIFNFSHGFGENLSANAKKIQIRNGCADKMSKIIFVTYFHVFILCKIACMRVVVQTQGLTWRPNYLTDGKWWNRIFISFLKEILVYIFKISCFGRNKMLTMLMVVRGLDSSSKMNEDQCEYLRLFCSRMKRKMCEIHKGSTYADYKESYFTAQIKQIQKPFERLHTRRNVFKMQVLHRRLANCALSSSVGVDGGMRAHARNRTSFCFPRLNAPLWFI